ncbi:hypothetical protein EGI24_14000, partial [Lacihabitans sp. CS3-21]|nr:hypothetical protein [Lacihabitans sp. CS3-21]
MSKCLRYWASQLNFNLVIGDFSLFMVVFIYLALCRIHKFILFDNLKIKTTFWSFFFVFTGFDTFIPR